MSVLVEHGFCPQDGLQMHPFFQPVRQTRQSPLSPSESQPGSLGHHEAKEVDAVESTSSSSPPSQAEDSSPSTSATLPQAPSSDGVGIDSNQHRSKRRKITPSSETYHASSPEHNKPTEAPQDERKSGEEIASVVHATDLDTADQQVNVSPQSQKHSDRLAVPASSNHPSVQSTRQLTINLSPAKSRQLPNEPLSEPQKTPKKKILQLSSAGKFVKSPKRSPVSKTSAKTRSAPSKNLSLKNGLIASSLKLVLPYSKDSHDGRLSVGTRIEQILSGKRRVPQLSKAPQALQPPQARQQPEKTTHPFFLGKAALPPRSDLNVKTDGTSTGQNSDAEATTGANKPKPWSEIKFNSAKFAPSKDVATVTAPWPPLALQHLGQQKTEMFDLPYRGVISRPSKQKQDFIRVPGGEDLLDQFGNRLSSLNASGHFAVPERCLMDPEELVGELRKRCQENICSPGAIPALQTVQRRLRQTRNAFDRGQAAGPHDWAHSYAPKKVEDVLQSQSKDLIEWLRRMKVHQVQSKIAATTRDRPRKAPRRKGRPKKRKDDMDDFIVSSDDEESANTRSVKNAIIICGPHGCGKTASVYAAAAELDFEVFEIHPGMRRGAKDIFDRVGDMTHNHLVQQVAPVSNDNSTLTDNSETVTTDHEVATGKQHTMAGFIDGCRKRKGRQAMRPKSPLQDNSSAQKQSVILLEEVDIVFEDDKSFWPGVQALIQQSRRPIILTCNSLENVPVQELPLHATLLYEQPPVDVAVEYISHIAAAEGHLLDRRAISSLYQSRGNDLRATLMDLDFWCQMTVGSKIGGLDWIHPASHVLANSRQPMPRIISCGTFYPGLSLVPKTPSDPEELLNFYREQLGISVFEWESRRDYAPPGNVAASALAKLDEALTISDGRSSMDIVDYAIAPVLYTAISNAIPWSDRPISEEALLALVAKRPGPSGELLRKDITLALDPLMEDLRTFPPPIGRTCPSIDGAGYSVATEIAPYVRSIVTFDQRLEQQRSELSGGSQSGKQRTTRAARAALEGGDKSVTRRERWFPKELDFEAVLSTGVAWPQGWSDGGDISEGSPGSPGAMEQ